MATTTVKSGTRNSEIHGITTTHTSGFWNTMEFNRFGIIPILLLIIGCIGGIAAGFGAFGNMLTLSLIVFPTIICLALILAVAPMRAIMFSVGIALLCDVLALVVGNTL